MMTLSLQTPLFSRLFKQQDKARSIQNGPIDDQPEHEAAMSRRALLAEMMCRSPDAFHSDLDLMMISNPFGGGI